MYDRAKKHVTEVRVAMMNLENTLMIMEREEVLTTGRYMWQNNNKAVFIIEDSYEEVLAALRRLANTFNSTFEFETGWLSYDSKIKFSWVFKDIPIEFWAAFEQGEVPAELLRGCEVKEVEIPAKTEKRLVCDVKKD